jgi:hypothetical protein
VVLEGSAVELTLESKNRKPLASAWLMLQTPEGPQRFDLAARDSSRLRWSLPQAKSPLAGIRRETQYELQVIDDDGLGLESPIRGRIRVQPDEAPAGAIQVIHKVVLPAAEPIIHYRATDDYGISKIALVVNVERGAVKWETGEPPSGPRFANAESHRFEVLGGPRPIIGDQLPITANYRLSLSPLNLAKGDSLKLALEVTDYRGASERGELTGRTAMSDSLMLEVSDESGVLAAISQGDQRSEQQLTEIIKRQLGIGAER